jgi:hypothetical protein
MHRGQRAIEPERERAGQIQREQQRRFSVHVSYLPSWAHFCFKAALVVDTASGYHETHPRRRCNVDGGVAAHCDQVGTSTCLEQCSRHS